MTTPTNSDLSQQLCQVIVERAKQSEKYLARLRDHYRIEHLGKSHPRFVALAPNLALRLDRLHHWVSSLWYEIQSQVHRTLHRKKFERGEGLYLGTTAEYSFQKDPTGCLVPDKRTQSRIRDMQVLATNQEWFGPAERWVYQNAWGAGARWAENNSHT